MHKKTVLGAGFNKNDHPVLYTNKVPSLHSNMGLHAEVAAISSLDNKTTKDAILYVVRLRKNDTLAMAKPCSSCEWVIGAMGIKRVIYSLDDGSFNLMRIR